MEGAGPAACSRPSGATIPRLRARAHVYSPQADTSPPSLGPADLFLDHVLRLDRRRTPFATLEQGSRRREQPFSVFN